MTTVTVRVRIALDRNGNWWTYGHNKADLEESEGVITDMADGPVDLAWKWLVAVVEIPREQEVRASVQDGFRNA